MQKMILAVAASFLISLTSVGAYAQDADKKDEKKPETTTIDAWREAIPQSEQPAYMPPPKPEGGLNNDPDSVETPAEIEMRILGLESQLMEAIKQRDAKTLRNLISSDFVLAGVNIPGNQADKARFIDWAQKNFSLKSYKLGVATVHSYVTSAVVTYNYKRQATVGDQPSDGDFTVTDVWVKSDNRWQAVSHHVSPLPKQ